MALRKYFSCWRFVEKPATRRDNGRKKDPTTSFGPPQEISWEAILQATQGFEKEIGRGGFSAIYSGVLPDGRQCAVKVVEHRSNTARQEFKRELHVLCRLTHSHVISLLAFCSQPEGLALVLEYQPNGTLYQSLQQQKTGTDIQTHNKRKKKKDSRNAKTETLSWHSRKVIAVQIASALEHLHKFCDPPIIHGDIKSSNILLDRKFNATLCDFGSSYCSSSTTTSSSQNGDYDSGEQGSALEEAKCGMYVMGSPGYLDPSIFRTGLPSKTCDVYSFGVILIELLTGLEAFSDSRNPKLLSAFVGPKLGDPEQCGSVVDERLHGKFDCVEVAEFGRIALMCISDDPLLRPNISHVLCLLRGLLERHVVH